MAVTDILQRLAGPWRARVGAASRQALLALGLLAVLAGAHVARLGTPTSRAAVAALLLLVLALFVVRTMRDRLDWRSPRRTLRRVLLPTDRALGERALRALTLAERAAQEEFVGSRDLARYHYERLLGRASAEAITRTAMRRAGRWRILAAVLLFSGALAVGVAPMRVVEGLNVLCAVDGRAPLPMTFIEYVRVVAQPPGYLRLPERELVPGVLTTEHPAGTLLAVRGIPSREGRKLVLTDGQREVAFVSDAAGGVVARWTVDGEATLRVAARFGDVVVHEPDPITVSARPDEPPFVEVQGAPRTVQMRDIDRLKILYSAADDHGLRQIDLVLRAGNREDRRVLARLSGETRSERGGHALTPRDPFLRRMFLPVQVTVEARDNDPLTGPKWGSSQPVTIVPPAVGEPEADRYSALRGARDLIVDLLAWQDEHRGATDGGHEERRRAKQVAEHMRSAVEGNYGGLSVPAGLSSFVLGQMRVLRARPPAGASALQRTEDTLLAIDVAIRGLAYRDAQSVALRLADVAEEAADGARQARETERRALGLARLDAALGALDAGGEQLLRLDVLGADLGHVTHSDRRRIQRARARDDLTHAELAARHLAARLRRPKPSTAVVRGAGTESGGLGGPTTWGDPSHADDLFDQLAEELAQLAQEHAGEIGVVERALAEAEQGIDLEELRDDAKRAADAVRRAISELPLPGAEPGSARASAALAREHAASMAQSLERLSLAEAVQSGRDAAAALRDAERRAQDRTLPSNWIDESTLKGARDGLAEQLEWAERVLERLRRRAESRARRSLRGSGRREQDFAQRATNLGARGRISETALPRELVDQLERAGGLMRQAAHELRDGSGERGLRLQRDAQRLLERSSTGRTTDDEGDAPEPEPGRSSGSSARGLPLRTDGDVPGASRSESANEFRKRALDGLGRECGSRLQPAVKRYAEGLLR